MLQHNPGRTLTGSVSTVRSLESSYWGALCSVFRCPAGHRPLRSSWCCQSQLLPLGGRSTRTPSQIPPRVATTARSSRVLPDPLTPTDRASTYTRILMQASGPPRARIWTQMRETARRNGMRCLLVIPFCAPITTALISLTSPCGRSTQPGVLGDKRTSTWARIPRSSSAGSWSSTRT